MWGRRYFGQRYWGKRYFGVGGTGTPPSPPAFAEATPPIRAIDILDKPRCAGGRILARATDCQLRRAHFGIVGDDYFELAVPASSKAAPFVTSRYIVAVEFAAGYHEWRLLDDTAVVSNGGGTVTGKAVGLIHDLASAGKIRRTDATTGLPTFQFTVEATPAELIDEYILGADLTAKGYGYFARGTIEPNERRTWQWNALNRLELLLLICAETGCEYRLRQTATQYLIDVVRAVNADLPPVEVRPGINLRKFVRRRQGAGHFTVIEPFGAPQPDGQRATIARNCWKVTAVDPAHDRITLAAPNGAGAGPIVETDQYRYDGPAPGWLFRYHQGGLHRILHTYASTQEVELDPGLAETYKVGDLVEIRGGPGASGPMAEYTDGWTGPRFFPRRVTGIDGGNKRLTIDEPFSGNVIPPVLLDDRYRGWTVRPYFLTASTTVSGSTPLGDVTQVTVGSTTGMQVGDLAFKTTAAVTGAPPWGSPTGGTLEVLSIDDATHVTVRFHRQSGPVGGLGATGFLSTWRARPDRVCTAASATTNTLDVTDLTGLTNGDLLDLFRQYDGPAQTELASPVGVQLYGVSEGVFERDTRGERTLLLNGHFRDFSGGPNALPDHWYATAGRAFGVKNTDPAFLNTGIHSVRLTAPLTSQLAAGISAGATSATLLGGSGHRLEVGESVILSFGLPNAETVVLTSVSPDGTVIGFPPCSNAHLANESVRAATLPVMPSAIWPTPVAGNATLVATPVDCPSVGVLSTYALRVVFYGQNLAAGDRVRVRMEISGHAERGGSTQVQDFSLISGTDIDSDVWNEAVLLLTQPVPGGRVNAGIGLDLQAGNAYPNDKALFVGAMGLTQTPYDPKAIPEYSFATELHQAANGKLALVSRAAPATYEFEIADLFGLDPAQWPHLQLLAGRTARTTQLAAGVSAEPLRIIGLEVDYDRPAAVVAQVGTRQQRIAELLANARVPVPLVQVTVDPDTGEATAQVTVGASQQAIQLPESSPSGGIIAIPPDFGFTIIT